MVSKILYYNQAQKFPQIQQDYRDIKQRVDKEDSTNDTVMSILEVAPPVRRLSSIPNKIQNGDALPALGLAGLAAVNLPEDWRDMKSAGGQVRSIFDKNYKYDPLYNRETHQHSFSFFRGTAIEKWLHGKINNGSKIAERLYEMDDTLYETKFGQKIKDLFGIKISNVQNVEKITDFKGKMAKTVQFESKIFGGEITARAMKRLPLLSILAVALLEVPKIFKAMDKGDNLGENITSTAKQTASSVFNATSTLAGIGYGGALGAKYGGATGSLVGMGLGAILGANVSKKLQDIIA